MCQVYKIGSEAAAVIQVSAAAMLGGIISELNGGSFSQGAIIAAASAAASMGLNAATSSSSDLNETEVLEAEQEQERYYGEIILCSDIGNAQAQEGFKSMADFLKVATWGKNIIQGLDGTAQFAGDVIKASYKIPCGQLRGAWMTWSPSQSKYIGITVGDTPGLFNQKASETYRNMPIEIKGRKDCPSFKPYRGLVWGQDKNTRWKYMQNERF